MKTLSYLTLMIFAFPMYAKADAKTFEKAKMELISEIEILVNIDECRKDLKSPEVGENDLPRSCNKLEYLSKYFFVKKNAEAINDYLNKEETRINENALKIVEQYKIKSLGKMTLSAKCQLSHHPVDLDIYLRKIKGEPDPVAISPAAPRSPATGSELPEVKSRK